MGRTDISERIIVQKYGGSSLSNSEKIQKIAQSIIKKKNTGDLLVIVVSSVFITESISQEEDTEDTDDDVDNSSNSDVSNDSDNSDGIEDIVLGTVWGSRSVFTVSGIDGSIIWHYDTDEFGDGGILNPFKTLKHAIEILAPTEENQLTIFLQINKVLYHMIL